MELRDYQSRAIEDIDRVFATGIESVILHAPTGSGKTVIAAAYIRRQIDAGCRITFLAPRRELVEQASEKLEEVGLQFGRDQNIFMAGHELAEELGHLPVQVCSKDTLLSRHRSGRIQNLPRSDFVFVDEAHLSVTNTWLQLLDVFKARGAKVIGLTATPARTTGGLAPTYQSLVCTASVRELTARKFLAPATYYGPSQPDLKDITVRRGDYVTGELSETMNQPQLVGDVITHWLQHAGGRQTLVFCVDVAHSVSMAAQFKQVGVKAEHIDGRATKEERKRIITGLRGGEIQVVTNCELCTYGLDVPNVSCLVIARPTKSLVLHLQILGRGLRTHDEKDDCLILDHAGNTQRHGFADDEREWSLEYGPVKAKSVKRSMSELKNITCAQCKHIYAPQPECPKCGYKYKTRGKGVAFVEGELLELKPTFVGSTHEEKKTVVSTAQRLRRNQRL